MREKKKSSFWKKIKKPIVVLAPMADVTDVAFREMFVKYGKPDVFWTEFVSADGLNSKGRKNLEIDLLKTEKQKPIVAQLFTSNPGNMFKAAELVKKLGFDGIDINMGCPDRSIEKQGAGADMIRNKVVANEVIAAAKKSGLPVSVKTRIGYNKDEIDTWIRNLLEQDLEVLTIHLRTRKDMSDVPAKWELIKKILKLRDLISKDTLIIGNGDVKSIKEAREKIEKYGVDGVMIGRGIFGNPLVFNKKRDITEVSVKEKLELLLEHTEKFDKMLSEKSFLIMRKHYKAYSSGFLGAKELRISLMKTNSRAEVVNVVNTFLEKLNK